MITLASFALTVIAFMVRNGTLQCLFTLAAAFSFVVAVQRSTRAYRTLFWYAFPTHLVAFYWLPDTLKLFGGFPGAIALLLHVLFAATAALQFSLAGWIYDRFPGERRYLFPAIFGLVDLLFPQLFPWSMVNPLISFHPVSALSELCGVTVLNALLLFSVEAIVRGAQKDRSWFALAATAALLLLGFFLSTRFTGELARAEKVKIGLIQGNNSLEERAARDQLRENLDDHVVLSRKALSDGAQLLIWPETVMTDWTLATLSNVRGTRFDPAPDLNAPLLYGDLSYRPNGTPKPALYNSARLIDSGGKVLGAYQKRVLMPFGEYLPLESLFPFLRSFATTTGDFTSGASSHPLKVSIGSAEARIVPLICYEDLVPELGAEGVAGGGNVFVNITNDAWYGDTAAPWQHLLLAQWRSIEMRRTLLRATNTGITTAVLPTGELGPTLATFQKGAIVIDTPLLTVRTLYSQLGDGPFTGLLALLLLVRILMAKRARD